MRKKGKNIRDINLVEALNYMVDILSLGLGKSKALKEIADDSKPEDEDIKNYVSRVVNKVDRLLGASTYWMICFCITFYVHKIFFIISNSNWIKNRK